MTIQIDPETERLIQQELQTGQFRSIDELIGKAVQALHDQTRSTPRTKRSPAEAIAHIRQNREGVILGDLKIKDLMNEGRP
jgi:Arc/MetJ-type ribon-helix-helix transcriptional regulator